MSHKPLSVDKLLKIKSKLPYGGMRRIARETGISPTAVYEVFNGEYFNAKVINAALRIIEEQEAEASALDERVSKIISE